MEEKEIKNFINSLNRIGIFALFPWFIICLVWAMAFNSADTDNGSCSCAVIVPFVLYPLWLIIFVKLAKLFISNNKPFIALLFSVLPFIITLGPLFITVLFSKAL